MFGVVLAVLYASASLLEVTPSATRVAITRSMPVRRDRAVPTDMTAVLRTSEGAAVDGVSRAGASDGAETLGIWSGGDASPDPAGPGFTRSAEAGTSFPTTTGGKAPPRW